MGSKGRIPPPHLRRPLPGPAIAHPESYGPGIHHAQGAFPPFDMMPPPEVMEQKLAAQHVEMQRLVTENQRLAATHGTLRQELAGAQHELQILHVQIGAVKSEREQQMRSLMDKIAKMEADLQSAEPFKLELQQARAEAQSLLVARQELFSRHQQLSQDLQRVHSDVQQIPALISELESLRQEYQHCRYVIFFIGCLMETSTLTSIDGFEAIAQCCSHLSGVLGRENWIWSYPSTFLPKVATMKN
jgi:regulator of replication initiation timing